jgi:hypothetical protein
MKTYGGGGCIDPCFRDLGTRWSWVVSSYPYRFIPGERVPGAHWIGDWVRPRAGLDDMEEWKLLTLLGLEPRPLRHPDYIQSLYRLRYPGSIISVRDRYQFLYFDITSIVAGTGNSSSCLSVDCHTLLLRGDRIRLWQGYLKKGYSWSYWTNIWKKYTWTVTI